MRGFSLSTVIVSSRVTLLYIADSGSPALGKGDWGQTMVKFSGRDGDSALDVSYTLA